MYIPLFLPLMAALSPYMAHVYEYCPAPGQFVNEIPEYEEGDDARAMCRKAEAQLAGSKMPGMVSLGAYGGYIVFGFDHPVVNKHGRFDFQIYGNALPAVAGGNATAAEPGIVYVSADTNGNGLPDDEWFELAGSEFTASTTRRGASVNYSNPHLGGGEFTGQPQNGILDPEYIYYRLDDGNGCDHAGWLQKVTFHTQSYWPQWLLEEHSLEFSGTLLASNVSRKGEQSFEAHAYPWGYADNLPNGAYAGFSLDWAVDEEGRPVVLKQADFIKVQTGVAQSCGWLGEISTEVTGAEDLHPDAVYSPAWPSDPIDPDKIYGGGSGVAEISGYSQVIVLLSADEGLLRLRSDKAGEILVYDCFGAQRGSYRISEGINEINVNLPKGIYIIPGLGKISF